MDSLHFLAIQSYPPPRQARQRGAISEPCPNFPVISLRANLKNQIEPYSATGVLELRISLEIIGVAM